ncbi:MAG: hypothetical protein ABIT16_10055 [Croceibacterium sp.]
MSALLDGELEPKRASQLQLEVASDAMLQVEFEELARVDASLRTMAQDAGFIPDVAFPAERAIARPLSSLVALSCALVLVRFLPKLIDIFALGIALQLTAAVMIAFTIVRLFRQQSSTVASTI